ncbi:MAG: glutaredoxin family protein [Acidimicrobiia bacterium]|nr:glutaredoxin family protein [Acidimicrobiia bacterium]MDH4308461.1 glutaredoxin family protein [Acidimicrobiia bacterium]
MPEPALRAIVVVLVVVVAGLGGAVLRRGAALRRRNVATTLEPGLHLFTAAGCGSCDRARRILAGAGEEFSERGWEDEPELFRREGIDRVPVLMRVGADGSAWRIHGVPSTARLRRWLGDP